MEKQIRAASGPAGADGKFPVSKGRWPKACWEAVKSAVSLIEVDAVIGHSVWVPIASLLEGMVPNILQPETHAY